jgi:hypothetical protein
VERVKLEAGGRLHLTRNRVTAARVFTAARPWSTPSKRSQTQRCLRAERRWNRTGDPSLPSMRGGFATPRSTSRAHTIAQVRGIVAGWAVGRGEVAYSAVSANLCGKKERPPALAADSAGSCPLPRSDPGTGVPSGHSASAFAFATAVGDELPLAWLPLHTLAAAITYSRVHTGVHYPGDVLVGSLMGTGAAVAVRYTSRALTRRRASPSQPGGATMSGSAASV